MNIKKINPRRKPVTQADVNRAKKAATDSAIKLVVYITLYALIDKSGFDKEKIQKIGNDMNYIADSVVKGYLSVEDIRKMVEEEYDFVWTGAEMGSK